MCVTRRTWGGASPLNEQRACAFVVYVSYMYSKRFPKGHDLKHAVGVGRTRTQRGGQDS